MNFEYKEIEPGKVYALETDMLIDPKHAAEMLKVWEEGSKAKGIIVERAKVKDVVTMPVEELLKLTGAIHRVRELHKAFEETNENGFVNICCSGCYDEDSSTGERFHDRYPCPTIKALDGEQS